MTGPSVLTRRARPGHTLPRRAIVAVLGRSPRQWQRDIEKHAACVAAGWEVVRLTAADLRRDAAPAAAEQLSRG
ncbi:hypothetical protein [uncultured Microbacterium sp.]|uniref:hypothetical protein n=1 Tax=uncultured Microbacterium sp. TaxID=191216 RepID=UPI0025E9B98D|nr:hypothetical protein [uncultured Microbacterium sp.]